jgi:predicted RNase H-like HicB family nuclease
LLRKFAGATIGIRQEGQPSMSEIIFEVREDEIDGGYYARALGYGIHTQGETLEELRAMVKDAVNCYFDETTDAPEIIAPIKKATIVKYPLAYVSLSKPAHL